MVLFGVSIVLRIYFDINGGSDSVGSSDNIVGVNFNAGKQHLRAIHGY